MYFVAIGEFFSYENGAIQYEFLKRSLFLQKTGPRI